jgi:anthranilate synthase/aminodeoxychorismate synthase-like glutamine amidotransferase
MTKSSGTILDGERRPEGQGAGMAPCTARLLLIDNYDSFTYNLVQAFLVLGADVHVYRNDAISVEQAIAFAPSHLCISPGPGTPYDAGVSMDMIRAFAGRLPVLGVCLGHQSIVEVFGGKVVRAGRLMHGKTSIIQHDGASLFSGLPQPCEVGRYHSLIAAPETLPPDLEVSARTDQGEIMAVRHRSLMVEGVQFHPESILTPDGPALMKNFLGFSGGLRTRGASLGAIDAVSA